MLRLEGGSISSVQSPVFFSRSICRILVRWYSFIRSSFRCFREANTCATLYMVRGRRGNNGEAQRVFFHIFRLRTQYTKSFFLFQDAIHSYGDRKLPINGLNSLNIVSSYKCLSYTDQSSCIEGLTKFNFFPAIFRKREAVFVLFLHLRGRGTDFKARAILVPRKCTANFL